jgi:hypothetical protein
MALVQVQDMIRHAYDNNYAAAIFDHGGALALSRVSASGSSS